MAKEAAASPDTASVTDTAALPPDTPDTAAVTDTAASSPDTAATSPMTAFKVQDRHTSSHRALQWPLPEGFPPGSSPLTRMAEETQVEVAAQAVSDLEHNNSNSLDVELLTECETAMTRI